MIKQKEIFIFINLQNKNYPFVIDILLHTFLFSSLTIKIKLYIIVKLIKYKIN